MECMRMVGVPAYMEGHWLNSLYNDALGHLVLNETNDSLRMVIALSGLQHAGVSSTFKSHINATKILFTLQKK